ncbi:MAG TPA: AraC family transcriptional regulator [Burkholderiaceae bacterium]
MVVVPVSQLSAFKAMKDGFAQRGLDLAALLEDAGLDPNPGEGVDAEKLADMFSVAWGAALARTGDPAIGLALTPRQPLIGLGSLSSLVLSSPDLRSGLQRFARYTSLVSPTASIGMDAPATSLGLHVDQDACRITLRIAAGRLPVPQQRYDFMAMTFLKGIFWLTGEQVAPLRVHHPYPAPADATPWERAFGCPVSFGAAAFVIELPLAALDAPFPTSDPTVGEMCERMVAQRAAEQGGCITARVRQALMQLISKGDPRRELVAAMLCMSERTLQRRLTEEGTSFIELVDDTRRELAQRYFVNGAYTPTEMSFALGFSDPSNFYRACKRWFGRTPNTLRCVA